MFAPAATLPNFDLNTDSTARLVGLTEADQQRLSQQPDSSDALVWLNDNGRARLIVGRRPTNYLPSLVGRDYFRAISTYPARYSADDAQPEATFLASVVSYRSAQRTAVLARRSCWADPVRPGQPNRATVCLMSTDIRCLRRAVLPPGFSFCVIDQRGEVLFHANPRLNLSENLLDDCQPAGGLRAALFTRGAQAVEAHYQGRESRLWVRPLGVAQPGLFLVTIADGEYLRDWQLRTGLATLRLLGAFWLLLLTLALAWRLLARRLALSSRIRQSFPRLWPRPSFAGQYWLIALAHLAGVALLYPFGVRLSPLGQAVGLLLLPLWLFGLTVGLLRVKADGPVRYQHSWLVLGGAVLTLNGLVAYYSYENEKGLWYWNDFWKLLGFQLALGAVLGLVAWLRPPPEPVAPATPALLSWLVDLLRSLGQGRPGWVSGLVRHDEPLRQTYRPAFSALVLAWIAVLGVVPAVYCYQLANLAERSIQLRSAHLAVLRQAEAAWARRLAPADGVPDTLDQRSHYLHFYAQTQWVKPKPAADLSKQQDLRRVRANRRFYQWLHRDLDDENRSRLLPTSSERVLPDAAPAASSDVGSGAGRYDDPAGYWEPTPVRSIFAPSAAYARYFSQVPALPRALQSKTDALVSGHGLFFATGAPSAQWLRPGYGLLPLGLLLLLGLLAALVHYLARECFLPASDAYRYPLLPSAVARGAAPPAILHRFLISPAAATVATLPGAPGDELRHLLQAGRLARISTRDLAGAAAGQWEDWLQRKIRTQGNPQRVVLEEVDLYPEDADVTERKRRAVELLLGQGKQVVLLSRCHPLAFVKCEHPLEPLCEVPSHVRQREAGGALLDALAGFRAEYLPLHGPPVPSAGPPPALSADQEEALRRECDGLPFLHEQRDYLKALVRAGQQRGQHPHAEHVVDLVRRLAQFHYRSLWRRLGPEEQFYLYDLAQDGLVNPHNRHVMETLVQKGFLRYNRHGRLLLCNDSFRQFALSAVPQRQVAAYEQRQRRRSTWAAWQLPLLLLLSSGLLFVFVTQRAAMSGAEQLLTAFVTLLPLLGRLLASFGSLGPSKGEIRT